MAFTPTNVIELHGLICPCHVRPCNAAHNASDIRPINAKHRGQFTVTRAPNCIALTNFEHESLCEFR